MGTMDTGDTVGMARAGGAGEVVLLLHGLWMNRLAMWPLAHALGREGFATVSPNYRSMLGAPRENLDRVAALAAAMPARRIHLVGHSLGGLLALELLQRQSLEAQAAAGRRFGRAVLLGAPVAGCEAGRVMSAHALGRRLLGETMPLWNAPPVLAVPRGCEVGVITGTRRVGLGSMLMRLAGANDGVVRVEETRIPGLADHRVLPVSHSGMLLSRQVARQCAAFLRQGRFAP